MLKFRVFCFQLKLIRTEIQFQLEKYFSHTLHGAKMGTFKILKYLHELCSTHIHLYVHMLVYIAKIYTIFGRKKVQRLKQSFFSNTKNRKNETMPSPPSQYQ